MDRWRGRNKPRVRALSMGPRLRGDDGLELAMKGPQEADQLFEAIAFCSSWCSSGNSGMPT
jgi:hypothetical protein